MTLLVSFITFGGIALLAAISPGPDFLVVTKNSLNHSRRIGVMTALGVGSAILVHVGYTIVGVGLIISSSVLLFSAIKLLGAIYLCYLGISMLRPSVHGEAINIAHEAKEQKSGTAAFREGFLTNVLNPKATIFFVSIFTQVVSPTLPLAIQSLYGIEAAIIVGAWFVALLFFFTHSFIRERIAKIQTVVLKIMGAALIVLGVKLALAER